MEAHNSARCRALRTCPLAPFKISTKITVRNAVVGIASLGSGASPLRNVCNSAICASNPVHVATATIGISFREHEKLAHYVEAESQSVRTTNKHEPLGIARTVSPIGSGAFHLCGRDHPFAFIGSESSRL